MEISSELIKDLRQRTGAGVMDCKAALRESKGDMEGAIDYLRRKGLAAAAEQVKHSRACQARFMYLGR